MLNKKTTLFLVFQYKEDAIPQGFSSPAHFRIQGGYHESDEGRTEIIVSNFGYKKTVFPKP